MNQWWFTADQHLDHPFICRFRNFNTCHQHDKALIAGWNDTVHPRDNVVVMGDVFWNNRVAEKWWPRLKGNKILVKGNHDQWVKKFKVPFKRIYNKTLKLEGGKKQHIVSCHYPILSWNRKMHGAIHVHGHSHGSIPPDWNRMDVGVDVAKVMFDEWRPFNLTEILYLLKENTNASYSDLKDC